MARPIRLRASPRRRERASWSPSEAPVSDTTRESMARDRWLVSSTETWSNTWTPHVVNFSLTSSLVGTLPVVLVLRRLRRPLVIPTTHNDQRGLGTQPTPERSLCVQHRLLLSPPEIQRAVAMNIIMSTRHRCTSTPRVAGWWTLDYRVCPTTSLDHYTPNRSPPV